MGPWALYLYHMYLVKRFTYFDFGINLLSLDLRLRILGNRILSKYIVFLRLAMTDYDQIVENIRKISIFNMSFSFIIIKDGESSGSQVFWELFLTCPLENLVLFSFFVTNFEWPLTTNNTRKLILVMCVSTFLPNLRFMFNNCYNPHCRMGSITANIFESGPMLTSFQTEFTTWKQ